MTCNVLSGRLSLYTITITLSLAVYLSGLSDHICLATYNFFGCFDFCAHI